MSDVAVWRFPVEAGVAVRGAVKREIQRSAWAAGLQVSVEESKGFLDSTYLFTISGDRARLHHYSRNLIAYLRELESDSVLLA